MILVYWISPFIIEYTWWNSRTHCSTHFGAYTALDPKSLRDIAIVTPKKDAGKRQFQEEIAQKLTHTLPNTCRSMRSSTRKYPCKTTIYGSINEAIAANPSMILVVRAPRWFCWPIAPYAKWKAEVQVDCAIAADRARDLEFADPETGYHGHDSWVDEQKRKIQEYLIYRKVIPPTIRRKRHVTNVLIHCINTDGKPDTYLSEDSLFVNYSIGKNLYGVFNYAFIKDKTSDVTNQMADEVTKQLCAGIKSRKLLD